MTKPMAAAMADPRDPIDEGDVDNAQRVKRVLKLSGLAFVLIFLVGVGTGLTHASLEDGGFTLLSGAILGLVVLVALACVWFLYRLALAPTGEAPPTRKERLNRTILTLCGALGFGIAMLMLAAQDSPDLANGLISNDPLPPGIAIVLLVLIGIILPILSFIWHRSAVDEQEMAAYKDGALWGINVFMMGAPLWWIAWRGGFAPVPDMIVLYFATVFVMAGVWMWKKYR